MQLEWTDGAAPIDIALAACSRRALALPSVPSLVRVRRRRRAQAIAVHAEGRAGAAAAGGRAGGGDRQAGGGRRDTTTSGEGGGALPEVSHSVVRLSVRRAPTATDSDRRRPSYCCSTSVGRSHARRAYVRVGARAEKITVEIGEDIDCWGLFSPCLPFSVVRGEPVCVAAARFGTLTCFVVSGAAAEAARKPAGGPPTELVG